MKKLIIVALFVLFAAATSKPAEAGIPLGHGFCQNGWAIYYEFGWDGIHSYISGCTN